MATPTSGGQRRCRGLARLAAGLALLAAVTPGCAAPASTPGGQGPALYVSSGLDGTVTRLDGRSGRVIGRPLPAGPAPRRLVVGSGGSLLVASAAAGRQGLLSHVAPSGGAWTARPVALERGARVNHLAGDGAHTAAVAYTVARPAPAWGLTGEEAPCRLALVDLRSGTVRRILPLCDSGDALAGLALRPGPDGLSIYAALWSAGAGPGARSRLLALDGATGDITAAYSLDGLPNQVVMGPAPGGQGLRLYSVVTAGPVGETDREDVADRFAGAGSWQLLGFDPATLALESDFLLWQPPYSLVVSSDGAHGYAFTESARLAAGAELLEIDLATGDTRRVVLTPGAGISAFAVAGDRLYVPDAMGDAVWVFDRHRGTVLGRVAVGRHPLWITGAPA